MLQEMIIKDKKQKLAVFCNGFNFSACFHTYRNTQRASNTTLVKMIPKFTTPETFSSLYSAPPLVCSSALSLNVIFSKRFPSAPYLDIFYQSFPVSFSSYTALFSDITMFICLLVYSLFPRKWEQESCLFTTVSPVTRTTFGPEWCSVNIHQMNERSQQISRQYFIMWQLS